MKRKLRWEALGSAALPLMGVDVPNVSVKVAVAVDGLAFLEVRRGGGRGCIDRLRDEVAVLAVASLFMAPDVRIGAIGAAVAVERVTAMRIAAGFRVNILTEEGFFIKHGSS